MTLRRNDGKRVRVSGQEIDLDGYSAEDAQKLIETVMREGHAKRNADWAKVKNLGKGDSKK